MLENGDNMEIVYLDFAKAYDKVDHLILIHKLQDIGISGHTLEWIKMWLTNRRQRVRVENELSQWDAVISGIPQGSVLGPLMFLIYIWDLQIQDIGDPKNHQIIYKYVDDTKLLGKTNSMEQTIDIQKNLDVIYDWQNKNNMLFNGSKFVRLSLGPSEELKDIPLFTPNNDDIIEQKEVTKDLGVEIDDMVSFQHQRLKALKKVKNMSSWALRTFTNRNQHLMKTLWKTLIVPIQDYASLLWAPIFEKGDLKAQGTPLRQFSKRVNGLHNLNYWQRLHKLQLLSAQRRNERYRLFYIWKSLRNLVPSLHLSTKNEQRFGTKIVIPKLTGKVTGIQKIRDRTDAL